MKRLLKPFKSIPFTLTKTKRAKRSFTSIGALALPAFQLAAMLMSLLFITAQGQAQSALDGFDPGADNFIFAVAVQTDGRIVVGGDFTTLGGGGTGTTTRNHIGRLNPDGSLDTSFDPGANGTVRTLVVQADGKILVGGDFTTLGGGGTGTTTRNFIGRLNPDGTLDASFDPGANSDVFALSVQADGKILVGGFFSTLGGGGTGTTPRELIGRLNSDGTIDIAFDPGANQVVETFAVQADGKILVGGAFSTLGGGGSGTTARNTIGRLNPDGTIDLAFDPGSDGQVTALVVQPDGKIVVGGDFTTLGGGGTGTTPRANIGRLNPDGSIDTGFDPGADGGIESLTLQANGQILVSGGFVTLGGGSRARIGRLNIDGALDAGFNPGCDLDVHALAVQADGKILVGGLFTTLGGGGSGTTTRNNIGRLYPDGSLDADLDPGADLAVRVFAMQADGKIVVGGDFTSFSGGTIPRIHLARINPDGSIDPDFIADVNDVLGAIRALAVDRDGNILVGGNFTTIGGVTHPHIARLLPAGQLDSNFNAVTNAPPQGNVAALAIQPDGNILLGGTFTTVDTLPFNGIARVTSDGSIDSTFNPGNGANGLVNLLALQADGKILVGGNFGTLDNQSHSGIGRLNPDGSVDALFNPQASGGQPFTLTVQVDQQVIVGGTFTQLNTLPRNHIGRLSPDGILDDSFDPNADNNVLALALQTDGKILLSGDFTALGATTRNHIARLNPDGTIDPNFDPGADGSVFGLVLQPDGKVVVGGSFSTLGTGNTSRQDVGRLTNTDPAFQSLTVDSTSTITWLLSGASPEMDRVTLEFSTDGIAFVALADPSRITGGWQLTGQDLPLLQNMFIRARGFYSTGKPDGSGSILENVRNAFITPAPVITSPLSASATAEEMFTYQITADNSPTVFDATNLPAWLTRDQGTGLLSGTPSDSDIGTFLVNISATNAGGTDTEVLTLDVTPCPPVITSPLSATATVGVPFTYQIIATCTPTSFDATGLPAGLTRDTTTGLISGTPSVSGTFSVTLSATNSGGSDTEVLTLDVAPCPPVITSPLSATATVGVSFTYQITATCSPTSFGATGLPAPLTVDPSTGLISGTPSGSGTFSVTLSATNSGGSDSKVLTLTVNPAPPDIMSPDSATATVGQAFTYQIVATNSPTSYDATPLPAGLSVNQVVPGVISGTPKVPAGTTMVTLSASNAGGTDTAPFTLTVQPAPVSKINIVSATSATGRTGQPFTFQVITSGTSSLARLSASGLPLGLSIDPVTGIISGTAAADGSSSVTITVTDGSLTTSATLELTFTSDPAIPVIVSASSAAFVPGQPFSFTIVAPTSDQNDPVTYSLIGTLPTGLTLDPVTGIISGIPQVGFGLQPMPQVAGGVVTNVVTIFACNSTGCTSSQMTFYQLPSGGVEISTRLSVGTGDHVLIAGFILQGNAPLKLLLRGIGPSLSGIVTDPLANPYLKLLDSTNTIIGSNDDWMVDLADGSQKAAIEATGVAPTNNLESAIVAILDSSSDGLGYTAIVSGKNNGVGVGLVEVYDLFVASPDMLSEAHLANISTRGYVQTGDNVMIGGFINKGSTSIKVLVRALGPSLEGQGVTGTLANPILDLHKPDGTIVTNDDWKTTQMQEIIDTTIPPHDDLESAIVATLPPTTASGYDAYTAVVRGANGTSGVALVEVYFGVP